MSTHEKTGASVCEEVSVDVEREFHRHLHAAARAFADGDHDAADSALHGAISYNRCSMRGDGT